MEALSVPELLFFCLVIILSYAIRGSAGFGGVTVPLLALFMSLKVVVPMVTFLGLVSSWVILSKDYRYVDWRVTLRILPSCLIGVLLGLYFFKTLDAHALARALGYVVLAYGGYSWWLTVRPAASTKLPLKTILPVTGTIAGFVGTMFGAMAGMFFAIYLDLLKFAKNEFRATASAILFALGIFRGLGYIAIGAYDRDALIACAAALPLMVIGIFLGNRIHANLNQLMFKRLIAGMMIASAVPLILR